MIDVKGYCEILQSGIKATEGFDQSIQESLDQVEICDTSTYDPIVLPSFDFEVASGTTLRYVDRFCQSRAELTCSELAEGIAGYLQQELFAETSDVGLYVSATRQAAFQSRRTSLRSSSLYLIADK
jgi:hypothetical protein